MASAQSAQLASSLVMLEQGIRMLGKVRLQVQEVLLSYLNSLK